MRLALILIGALAWLDLMALLVMGMTLDRLSDRIARLEGKGKLS